MVLQSIWHGLPWERVLLTEILSIPDSASVLDAATRAAGVLDEGGLVVFPTETVYGLAARADLPEAMARLRAAKSRGPDKAFTLHLGSIDQADRYVHALPPVARRLIRKTWPGPLTVIVPVKNAAGVAAMAGKTAHAVAAIYHEASVGLRCPGDTIATHMLSLTGGPVVAASANLAGEPPPRTAQEACVSLREHAIDLVLDSGDSRYRRPSTIVQMEGGDYHLVREGVLDAGIIERLAVLRIVFVCTGNTCRSPMAEGFAKAWLAERIGCEPGALSKHNVEILSAGTAGGYGGAAAHSVSAMAKRGIDIAGHQSKALTAAEVNNADLVVVMASGHRHAVLDMAPQAADCVIQLLDQEDVFDPIGGTSEDYERCAQLIERGVRARLKEIEL